MTLPRLASFLLLLGFTSFSFASPQPGDFLTSGPSTKKQIALTFDDGPGAETPQFLALLDKYKVKATFFMLGQQVKSRPKIAKDVAAAGHEVANHTMIHTNYLRLYRQFREKEPAGAEGDQKAQKATLKDLMEDLDSSRRIIENTTGEKLALLRMPHGVDRPWVKEAAQARGFVVVNWTYGSDWTKASEEEMVAAYVKAVKPGAVLLFHDGGSKRARSLAATEAVLKAAQEKGFEVVTLGELIGLPN